MIGGIGWPEMVILLVAALVVLGPERLPGAIRWTTTAIRQARDYVNSATDQLQDELGSEIDVLREPLSELKRLRGMTPRELLTTYALDGDDSILTGEFGSPAQDIGTGGEKVDPANCGIFEPGPAPDAGALPPIDTDAT